MVGESMAGKTSLVDALMKGTPTEIRVDDRTFGVVFYHWKPEPHVDELELVVVDCAGQKKYQMTHQLFMSEGSSVIMGNLHYRLKLNPGKMNKIFYHTSKEHLKFSKISKFGCEMLKNEENIALRGVQICI